MIRPASYAQILNDPNAKLLLYEYALECSIPELGYASPQAELYELLERSGGFQAFGVYEQLELQGFATVLDYVLPHYGAKVATSESIFVSKNHPKAGMDLLVTVEEYAARKDCLAFLYSAPVGSRFDRLLATSNRYRHTNNVYLKTL